MATLRVLLLIALAVSCSPQPPLSPSSPLGSLSARLSTSYWSSAARALATAPYGNVAALSCHNCYAPLLAGTPPSTTSLITGAIAAGADLIELDVTLHADGVLYVEHDETTLDTRPRLDAVLAIPELMAADQLLFIEIKDADTDPDAFGRKLIDTLSAAGYPSLGRPVVLRGFEPEQTERLDRLRELLDTTYTCLSGLYRLQVLVHDSPAPPVGTLQSRVDVAVAHRYDGIEFPFTHRDLFAGISYAQSHGLGVNVYTLPGPAGFGDVLIAALRNDVDAITTDYPLAIARAIIEEPTGLVYADMTGQDGSAGSVHYQRAGLPLFSAAVNAPGSPLFSFVTSTSESLFGGTLVFAGAELLRTYDADQTPSPGYLASVSADFDVLEPADGDTIVALGKADSAGFTLELYNPPGAEPSHLRFGAHISGGYKYAVAPLSFLSLDHSHFIIGAYDGTGRVRLWVDGIQANPSIAVPGSVSLNDSDVLLGADPQGPTGSRFYFRGRLQHAVVQRWSAH